MSNSNEILKKCSTCEIIQLIENFNKEKKRYINCRRKFYLKNLDKNKKYKGQHWEGRKKS